MSDRFEGPGRLGKAGLIALVVASFVAMMALASSASATSIVPDNGPFHSILAGPGLDCQIFHNNGDGSSAEFDTGEAENYCDTTVYTDFNDLSYGEPDYTDRSFFEVSQDSAQQGAGTEANPYTVTTIVQALPDREVTSFPSLAAEPDPNALLTITQVDSYVNGDDFYRTDVTVHNDLGVSQNVGLYHAGDCSLENDDLGLADQDSEAGPVFCTPDVSPQTDLRTAATSVDDPAILGFIPVGTDSHFKEAVAGEGDGSLFDEPANGTQYMNSCDDCGAVPGEDDAVDNGTGLSWALNLPAGGSERRCFYTVDSWDGNEPDVPSSCTPQAAKPPTIAQQTPPKCKLRISRARVFLFSRHPRLRLVARYRSAAPADVEINFKAIENGQKVNLGDITRHFNRHGLFRLRHELTQNESDTLWQTHKFVVHFKIPGEASFCQRKYRKELTVPRIVDGQRVVFQSDSKFGPGSPGHPEHG